GYSLPRPGASHLQARPQFAPGGPDWTPDTVQEFDHDLLAVNEPFDMVSIHFYAPDEARPSGPYGANFDPMIEAAKVVHAVGKRLFIGEFGDIEGATPFMHRLLLSDILHAKVDFAAIWVWEFYQTSTYETLNTEPTRFDIEPAYAERTIQLLKRSANLLGKRIWLGSQSTLRVILTWPLPCAKVTGVTKLSAVASDGTRPVKRIEFFVNNDFAGSSSNSPYSLSSDLSRAIALGSGFIKIEARAIASSGATRSFASFLEVSDGSSGPKVK
ncbi:MAG: hypothetical protein JO001_26720, partial [Alphaproteobacteria bacterium]|nr:hypothetical protein [Alphaproteobacteria bacterium]